MCETNLSCDTLVPSKEFAEALDVMMPLLVRPDMDVFALGRMHQAMNELFLGSLHGLEAQAVSALVFNMQYDAIGEVTFRIELPTGTFCYGPYAYGGNKCVEKEDT